MLVPCEAGGRAGPGSAPVCLSGVRPGDADPLQQPIVSLRGLVRLRLKIRRCEDGNCGRYHQAWRPEAEAALALPQHEFGLDVSALLGALRSPAAFRRSTRN